jgi:hypothetical protein
MLFVGVYRQARLSTSQLAEKLPIMSALSDALNRIVERLQQHEKKITRSLG